MNRELCSVAKAALVRFFETYEESTVVYLELPDTPNWRALDNYFYLGEVQIIDDTSIRADLGYSWSVSLIPSKVEISGDLFELTISGSDLHLESSTIHRKYHEGWVRFYVIPNTDITNAARDENGTKLRELQLAIYDAED
ncbi:hypothetical protein GONAM_02_00460 [Gordonia namibiensis NBRC 108229]|uniref:Uncharacterized protein n=1 Tax=Gordonia namibiensis NBRC 108229 TaxID=1208314 RepID=K6XI59_9ACTN|nr:hypothetical protein [Gordonia namibiensis]GAB98524.1 hypothetical protein GONAM_02_00460 [Gordonia namibiensis NBRC 108229]